MLKSQNVKKVSPRSAAIDLMRIAAVAGVIIAHWTWDPIWVPIHLGGNPIDIFGEFSQIGRYGFLGVHIFFIISGAVIVHTAIGRAPRDFVVARFTRLFPALTVSIVITALILWNSGISRLDILSKSLSSLLFLTPRGSDTWINPVLWTLQVEIYFYALICLVCLFVGAEERNLWRFSWIWFGITVLTWINQDLVFLKTVFMTDYAPFFIIGMMLSLSSKVQERILVIPAIVSSLYIGSATIFAGMDPFERSQSVIALVITFGTLLMAVALWSPSVNAWNSKLISKIGLMTYSLYLFHEYPGKTILGMMLDFGSSVFLAYLVSSFVVIAIAFAVTQWLEPLARNWFTNITKLNKTV